MGVDETITVVLKNPKALTEENFEMDIGIDMTVGDLKRMVESDYPGNPRASSLTLVYAGKVLRDEDLVLSEIFPRDGGRVAVHLVIRQTTEESSSAIQTKQRTIEPDDESVMPTPPATGGLALGRETVLPTHMQARQERESTPETILNIGESSNNDSSRARNIGGNASTDTMYDSVLRASYQAALRVIMDEGLQGSSSQGFTFIPAIIPVPQTLVQNNDGENQQHFDNQYMVPMVPFSYAFPQMHLDQQDGRAVRHRRRNAQDANVRALFRAIQQENNNNNDIGDVRARERRNQNNNPRQIQIRIHLNVRMLLQLGVVFFILYQHCPPSRFLGISLIGLLFYLSTTRLGRMLLQRLAGHFNMQRRADDDQPGHVHAPAEVANADDNAHLQRNQSEQANDTGPEPAAEVEQGQAPPPPAQPGLLREVQSFLAGFLASILPAADQHRNAENHGVVQDVFRAQ